MQNKHLDLFTKSNFVLTCEREGSEDFTTDLLRSPLPSMSMPATKVNTPTINHMKTVLNTAHIDYGGISADVLLDENFDNHLYFFKWMLSVQKDKNWLDKSRVFIYIKSNKGNTILKVEVFEFILVDIGEISLDSTANTEETEVFTVGFEIGYIEIARLIDGDWIDVTVEG